MLYLVSPYQKKILLKEIIEIIPYLRRRNVRAKWNAIVEEHKSLLKLELKENKKYSPKYKQATYANERMLKPELKEKAQLNMRNTFKGDAQRNYEKQGGPTNIVNVGVTANFHYHPAVMNFQYNNFNAPNPNQYPMSHTVNQINPVPYQQTYFTFNPYSASTSINPSLMKSNNAGNKN